MRSRLAIVFLSVSLTFSLASLFSTTARGPLDFRPIYAGGIAASQGLNPYSLPALCKIESSRTLAGAECLPFLDPPPFTALVLPFSVLPFQIAAFLWVPILLVFGLAVILLAAQLAGLTLARSPVMALLVLSGTLLFFPIKHGLALGQIDSISAAAALAAIGMTSWSGGWLATTALLVKPQTAFLPLAMLTVRRPRILIGALLAAIASAALTALIFRIHTIETLTNWLTAIRRSHTTPIVALAIIHIVLAGVLLIWLYRRQRKTELSFNTITVCAIAAAFNGLVGPLVYLQTDSLTLLILPLLIATRPWLVATMESAPIDTLLLGLALGLLVGSALFPGSYYTGWTHSIVPWATFAIFTLGIVLRKPSLRGVAATALVTNALVTLPPWPPAFVTEFASAAASLLVILVVRTISLDRR